MADLLLITARGAANEALKMQYTRQLLQHLATHDADRAALASKYLVELLALATTRGLQDIIVWGILERILVRIAGSAEELIALLRRLKACIHVNSAPAVCKLSIRLLPRVVRAAVDHLHPPSDHAVTVWQACADAVAATIAVMVADANAVRDSMRGMAAAGLYVTAAALTAMPQDAAHTSAPPGAATPPTSPHTCINTILTNLVQQLRSVAHDITKHPGYLGGVLLSQTGVYAARVAVMRPKLTPALTGLGNAFDHDKAIQSPSWAAQVRLALITVLRGVNADHKAAQEWGPWIRGALKAMQCPAAAPHTRVTDNGGGGAAAAAAGGGGTGQEKTKHEGSMVDTNDDNQGQVQGGNEEEEDVQHAALCSMHNTTTAAPVTTSTATAAAVARTVGARRDPRNVSASLHGQHDVHGQHAGQHDEGQEKQRKQGGDGSEAAHVHGGGVQGGVQHHMLSSDKNDDDKGNKQVVEENEEVLFISLDVSDCPTPQPPPVPPPTAPPPTAPPPAAPPTSPPTAAPPPRAASPTLSVESGELPERLPEIPEVVQVKKKDTMVTKNMKDVKGNEKGKSRDISNRGKTKGKRDLEEDTHEKSGHKRKRSSSHRRAPSPTRRNTPPLSVHENRKHSNSNNKRSTIPTKNTSKHNKKSKNTIMHHNDDVHGSGGGRDGAPRMSHQHEQHQHEQYEHHQQQHHQQQQVQQDPQHTKQGRMSRKAQGVAAAWGLVQAMAAQGDWLELQSYADELALTSPGRLTHVVCECMSNIPGGPIPPWAPKVPTSDIRQETLVYWQQQPWFDDELRGLLGVYQRAPRNKKACASLRAALESKQKQHLNAVQEWLQQGVVAIQGLCMQVMMHDAVDACAGGGYSTPGGGGGGGFGVGGFGVGGEGVHGGNGQHVYHQQPQHQQPQPQQQPQQPGPPTQHMTSGGGGVVHTTTNNKNIGHATTNDTTTNNNNEEEEEYDPTAPTIVAPRGSQNTTTTTTIHTTTTTTASIHPTALDVLATQLLGVGVPLAAAHVPTPPPPPPHPPHGDGQHPGQPPPAPRPPTHPHPPGPPPSNPPPQQQHPHPTHPPPHHPPHRPPPPPWGGPPHPLVSSSHPPFTPAAPPPPVSTPARQVMNSMMNSAGTLGNGGGMRSGLMSGGAIPSMAVQPGVVGDGLPHNNHQNTGAMQHAVPQQMPMVPPHGGMAPMMMGPPPPQPPPQPPAGMSMHMGGHRRRQRQWDDTGPMPPPPMQQQQHVASMQGEMYNTPGGGGPPMAPQAHVGMPMMVPGQGLPMGGGFPAPPRGTSMPLAPPMGMPVTWQQQQQPPRPPPPPHFRPPY